MGEMSSAATQLANSKPATESTGLFSSPEKRTVVLSLALILLTVLVYIPIHNNAFINFDDNQYITENAHVRSGLSWETLEWAFTTFDAANWHPLTWLSHALDCQLFGLNPGGHHLISVLLHAMNVVLLFVLLQNLTGFTWRSLMVAALFAVHPLNVESVAWAAERKTVLSMTFFLFALWAYWIYVRKPSVARYLGVAGLFALSLMSKPQVITFPFVLLLLDYWPLRRLAIAKSPNENNADLTLQKKSISQLLAEKIPLFLLSALSAVLTVRAQRAGDAVRTIGEYTLGSRVENAVMSYIWYVRDVFFPWHLAAIYPHPEGLTQAWKLVLASTVLTLITVLTIVVRKRSPYLPTAWFWFLGTMVPMIGLVQVGFQSRADRYMYVPMLGLLVATVWGAIDLMTRFKWSRVWLTCLCGIALVALSVAAYRQIGHWRNSEILWNYTLKVTDPNFKAEDNLARELADHGRTEEAMVHFHNALAFHDFGPTDLIMFGVYEQHHGYSADAIKQYERALRNTTDPKTRAIELSNMGLAYADVKDAARARQSFDQALQIDPDNFPALIGSGILAQKSGNSELAIREYTKALSIKPSDLGYTLLGRAFEQSGRSSDANAAYAQAQKLSQNIENTRAAADHLLSE
jgi:cytochrome c-type biogenesis protein CcmH/NrfG